MRNIYFSEKHINILKESTKKQDILMTMSKYPLEYAEKYEDGFFDNGSLYNKLIGEGYFDSVVEFSDDITKVDIKKIQEKYSRLLALCIKKERQIKDSLEQLCYNVIVDIFNIPEDTVYINGKLVSEINQNKTFHIEPDTKDNFNYTDTEQIESLDKEISKRKLLNCLIYGASIDIVNNSLRKYAGEIFELDEELPHLYSKLMKIGTYLMYHSKIENTDKQHNQGGFVEVHLGNDIKMAEIVSEGIVFPILLTETIKGLFEVCISNGLPDEIGITKFILNHSDVLKDEPFNMALGYPLWKRFINGNDVDTKVIPYYMENISSLDANTLLAYAKEIASSTEMGKKISKALYQETLEGCEYDDFNGRILKRKEENDLITDSYLGEDDLYPIYK